MDSYQTLQVQREDNCVTIRLNRTEAANAVNRLMASELARAAHACEMDTSVRAVLLTGNGRFFCAGGDIGAMAAYGEAVGSEIKLLVEDFHQAISSFARMKAPLLTAVNGPAAGAGFSLAVSADLVLASADATFTMAYTAAGLSPDGSSSWYLPRLIGLRRTQELMFTNRRLKAVEAQEWGLVTHVVPAIELEATAREHIHQLVAGSLSANAFVKQLLLASPVNGLETQMALEARSIAAAVASPDGREGVEAFMQKRAPRFRQ